MLISQCSKRALSETRRILDQFAERKGDCTWQTSITQQGLITLRKMLRKSAKRNTAVACHWIKSAGQTELLWIVGNLRAFNDQGTVPTNTTECDILRVQDENQWNTADGIALLAAIGGLFHDFGKANKLFQLKLKPKAKMRSEPYRHEWVSLRLFESFVDNLPDQKWLEKLVDISDEKLAKLEEESLLKRLIKDDQNNSPNPFFKNNLPPLARTVGWLIVSHHRLPKFNDNKNNKEKNAPTLDHIDDWMTGKRFNASWNSSQCENIVWDEKYWKQVWEFDKGTPLISKTWRKKALSLAKRALGHPNLFQHDWLQDRFSSHMARLTLMLADHCYSAGGAMTVWQDPTCETFANTDQKTRLPKQKLDEHNVGVGHQAYLLAKVLPKLRMTLPAITRHKGFKQRSKNPDFHWQDKAYDLARSISENSKNQGFFGVNMASTGCGKTFGNARIMYGLADEKVGCRFNVSLGLRTLTLQTGTALREKLNLESDDLAVLIGSQSVQVLYELQNNSSCLSHENANSIISAEQSGSESVEDIFNEHQYVSYDGSLEDGRLGQWIKHSPKLHKLLSAPVLVSTIDHLIPATEGERGGKQIAPMLRLLTSDLVLDEPDDFDLSDLHALSRLVNWAGMLGSRVLLSSATLPPSLVQALFESYLAGRKVYNASCGEPGVSKNVCCAWFDEFNVLQTDHGKLEDFAISHAEFVDKRIKKLKTLTPLRLSEILPVNPINEKVEGVIDAMSMAIYEGIHRLHNDHHQVHPLSSKRISIGLVRMANINPLVEVAKKVLSHAPRQNYSFQFCIYHSQHPLLVRSKIEEELDEALIRHNPEKLWEVPSIKSAIDEEQVENIIFIVFATSVAEVGRDHDYDWAIAEPSSMRSLIQLAGRIERHRKKNPSSANLLILSKNYRALRGELIAFTKPGFESKDFKLQSKNMMEILEIEQYQYINAISRIRPRGSLEWSRNLVDLEHVHLQAELFGSSAHNVSNYASRWWNHNPTWCSELQRRKPFRNFIKEDRIVLYFEEEGEDPRFHLITESGERESFEFCFTRTYNQIQRVERVRPWMNNDVSQLSINLAEKLDLELAEISLKFAEIRLRESKNKWSYHPWYGVYGTLE